MKRKSPILAAVLNFLFPGVGYLYVGRRVTFAVLLFIGYLFGIFAFFIEEFRFGGLELVSSTVVAIAFAIDAWSEASNHNKSTI